MAAVSLSPDQLLSAAAHCIPPLLTLGGAYPAAEFGVLVVGGSADQCGPPCLSAMAAMRAGAYQVHIVCSDEAGPPVRSFSPELAVHPVLDSRARQPPGNNDELRTLLNARLPLWQAVLIGPGLGDSTSSREGAAMVVEFARSLNKPLVIDGDGLSLIADRPDLIRGYSRALLTLNAAEFGRLYQSLLGGNSAAQQSSSASSQASIDGQPSRQLVARLAAALAGPCILLKGREDILAVAAPIGKQQQQQQQQVQVQVEICALQGCGRHCAGQGAILSGLALVFCHWCFNAATDSQGRSTTLPRHPALLAGYAASALARRCGAQAFAVRRRATLATDQLDQIGTAFSRLFPEADCSH